MSDVATTLEPVTFQNNQDWNESFEIDGLLQADYQRVRAYMQMRPFAGALEVVLDLSSPRSGMSLDPLKNFLRINAPYSQMKLIPAGEYIRDIVIIRRSREYLFAGRGNVTIIEGITSLRENPPWQ